MDILQQLSAPFAPDKVSWRVGSTTKDKTKGMALGYIDARDVMERLDDVVGCGNWQDRYEVHGGKTICYLSLRESSVLFGYEIAGSVERWVTKADGAGDSDIEAEKGALSDAFKRAAVKWGIGRYLYDLDSPWVELETYEKDGKVYVKGISEAGKSRLKSTLMAPEPEARALNWAMNNTKALKAAMHYEDARKVLEEAGIVTERIV